MLYYVVTCYILSFYITLFHLISPCGRDVLHFMFQMSRTKRPMQHHSRTSSPTPSFVNLSRETPDVTPCRASPPQGVVCRVQGFRALPIVACAGRNEETHYNKTKQYSSILIYSNT